MTATLEQIHSDPAILDRAISRHEQLDIVSGGGVAATLTPAKPPVSARLSPDELGRLADQLADAPDEKTAAAIRDEMIKGFYGEPRA